MEITKVFKSGRSQAVRIPKSYRFDSNEVGIKKSGNAIILLPLKNPWDILFEGISEFESNLIRETQELQIREDIL